MSTPQLHRTDGDGWVDCACGQRHWGRFGASGLLLIDPDRGVLLQHRAPWSHYGGTWGMPGGARSSGESAVDAALREASEEAAVEPAMVRPSHLWLYDHGPWSYTTVVGDARGPIEPYASDPESLEIRWVPVDDVARLPLLPAFGEMWPDIRGQAGRDLTLVVDVANVMGSRPDGWWRDRAGAARRLIQRLGTLTSVAAEPFGLRAGRWFPRVVAVVEGQSRKVDPVAGVEVVRAPASGDDAIVSSVADALERRPADHVVAVTADRELRGRVESAGGRWVGPGVLLDLLDAADAPV